MEGSEEGAVGRQGSTGAQLSRDAVEKNKNKNDSGVIRRLRSGLLELLCEHSISSRSCFVAWYVELPLLLLLEMIRERESVGPRN